MHSSATGGISMKDVKIRMKLLIIVLTILIPMMILTISMIENHRKHAIETELRAGQEYAEAISMGFMNYVNKIWHAEFTIGQSLIKNQSIKGDAIQAYLKDCASDENLILSYFWADPKGIIISSSKLEQIGISITDREYYKAIVNGDEKVVSDLVISKTYKIPTITISRGIRTNGELKGVVTAVIDADTFSEIMPKGRLGKTSSFGLVDRNGMIVFRKGSANLPMEKREIKDDAPVWKSLQGEVGYIYNYSGKIDNQQRFGTAVPISEIGWASFATIVSQEALEKANSAAKISIITMILITLISLAIVLYIIADLLRPIKALQNAANEIACTNYSTRINLQRKDELGQTARAFDKMMEGIDQYDKLKTQFFANLSHELKTPLNVIFTISQLIPTKHDKADSGEYRAEVNKYMLIIKQNCYRLLRLIGNLIDITRFDGGYLSPRLNNCNIINIVEEITQSVVRYAEIKKIAILFDTEIEEKIIACDPDFMERIILNLLSNAIKFTNEGGSIIVNIYDKQDSLVISVKDTGIGIPDDKVDEVFERFRQVDSSLSRNHEGSGIGLSLVKALVEAHGGTISVLSKFGEGTEFIIELPAIQSSEERQDMSVENNIIESNSLVERITIEFSDIYFK
jgi:signal transduction histidine kinase